MDDALFDDLARSAAGRTRRQLIKGLAGALAAGLIGGRAREAVAAACRDAGSTCSKNAHCCSGFCGAKDATGRRRCACPKGYKACGGRCIAASACCGDAECSSLTAGCLVGVCSRSSGQCQAVPAQAGKACDSGYLCSVKNVCDGEGNCTPTPKDCSDVEDDCNTSFCIAETGQCAQAPINHGQPCASTNPCATQSVCDFGTCKDVAFKNCSDLTTDCATGVCVGGTCQAQINDGQPCSEDECNVGTCQANGTCATEWAQNGTTCNGTGHCCYGDCYSQFTACPV